MLVNKSPRQPLPSPNRLVLGLVLLVLSGTFLLMLPFESTARPLTWNEALFTATSALTVTGLATITPGSDLSFMGQVVLLGLIQVGGVGFMVVAVVILRLLGRRITLAERLALSDSLGMLAPRAIINLTGRVLLTILLLEGLGALLLYLHWRNDPRLSEEKALFFAIFHAVSAFCNAGFDLFSGTPGYPDGIPRDNLSLSILGTLILVGGLGIPVIGDLLTYRNERRVSLHTRVTLIVVTFLVLVGTLGFFLAERRPDGTLANEPLARQILVCLFQSISARTAGFAGIAEFADLSTGSRLLMTVLMFIGCPPASMGGGITTGTFAALTISLWSYAQGHREARWGGRTLAMGTVRRAAAVLTISIFIVTLASWLLLMTHPVSLEVAVFEVVSAFATCGLSLGLTGELNLFGQLLICLMMFWGRLGALTVIIVIARPQSRPELIQYPEEQILIG
ncbi:MAG: TrkH family potassium uptake protein [Oscillochloridaceae bacterium umkhey_bin13]